MDNRLFLLDAYALIYRGFWALQKHPSINSKGIDTTAVMGFVNQLEEILNKEKPTHIGVALDPKGGTFRHKIYTEYKAQREKTPEGIVVGLPYIMQILDAYNIPVYEVENYEADDVIGTLANMAANQGVDTYMVTPDKDYAQLVKDHIFMYRPSHTGHEYHILGTKEVIEKYGLQSPTLVIDMLGLMGDSSDNIPGCPGVGEKTAVKLINEFGSVENIISNTDKLKGALKLKIENNAEQIKFSKMLATIVTDVPVELNLENLKRKEIDKQKLKAIFDELEFRSLSRRILGTQTEPKPQKSFQGDLFANFDNSKQQNQKKFTVKTQDLFENQNYERLENLKYNYKLVDNEKDIDELIQKIFTFRFLSLDTETTSVKPTEAELVGLSFAMVHNEAYYVPIPKEREKALIILNKFKEVYENKNIVKIGQNLKYDIIVLANYGIEVKGEMFDTMLAHYVLHSEQRHNMDQLAKTYLNYEPIPIESLIGEGKNQMNMRDLKPESILNYAAEDANVTLKLKDKLEEELKKENLYNLFHDIEMPLMPVLAKMEINGVNIDTQSLKETSIDYGKKMEQIESEIYELAGEKFNISSPKQVGELLFEKLNLVSKPKKTKSGNQYATSEEVLIPLKKLHPVVEKILEYRGYKKLLSTYIDALPLLLNEKTGKIHTSFNQAVTSTGRLSSSDPNLQNIPVREDIGKEVRKAFVPEEGCEFLSADYSQVELRIMAYMSGDENMIEAFNNGYDIHAATAANIYKIPVEEVTKDMRRKAKTANFGIIYGITVFGLAERMEVPRAEARELIDGYFNTYPKIKQFMDESIKKGRENGYAVTLFGRRCDLPKINSLNGNERSMQERIAINAPIQGTAADIMKIAMINIDKRMTENSLKSKMILQVHDELNFSVVPEEKEILEKIVKEEMENAYKMSIPLIAECGWGKNWLEAH